LQTMVQNLEEEIRSLREQLTKELSEKWGSKMETLTEQVRKLVSEKEAMRKELRKSEAAKGKGKVVVVHEEPVQPLAIQRICVSPELMEVRGDGTFFGIEVFPESGNCWTVHRRYNQFHDLHNDLGSMFQSFPDAPFPRKHMLGCTGQKLEDRRRGLEVWLQRALQQPGMRQQHTKLLRDFLQTGRVFIASPGAAPAAVAPNTPGAGRPASTADSFDHPRPSAPPADPPVEEDASVVEVVIPEGVVPGQVLAVTVPDGKQVHWTIPEGVRAGSHVELFYNAEQGTLTRLT